MMDQVALVTGAGRGIGLELCRLLLERGYTVVACPRRPQAEDLAELGRQNAERLFQVALDVRDVGSIGAAAFEIRQRVKRIDLLVNNAAVYPDQEGGLERLEMQDLLDAFDVNAVGPLRVIRAMLPLLRKGEGKRLIQITSLMGSIDDNSSGGAYAYRMSKTALNMAVRNLAHELGPEGFVCLAVHPGWVRTHMGGPSAPLEIRAATEEVLRVALAADLSDNGGFKGPGGVDLPY
jgi:NAD(P)-dependent dehydrogenase (short-subunit alcohol dehydrogenase family)